MLNFVVVARQAEACEILWEATTAWSDTLAVFTRIARDRFRLDDSTAHRLELLARLQDVDGRLSPPVVVCRAAPGRRGHAKVVEIHPAPLLAAALRRSMHCAAVQPAAAQNRAVSSSSTRRPRGSPR